MIAKFSLGLVLAVSLAAAASVSLGPNAVALENRATANVSHNLIVGSRVPYDYLLSQQIVSKSSSWLQIVTQEVTFRTPSGQTISQVRALDQKTNGNGASASITYGGPGNRNVTVRFKSQRSHGISFILEVYGR